MDTMAKSLILSVPTDLLFGATSKLTYGSVQDQMHIVSYDQKWYPINHGWIFAQEVSGKIGNIYKSTENQQNFSVTLTETLVCWVIRSWVIQVYPIHKSSQLLSVWSISAHIQCVFWSNLINTIIFHQIDFVAIFSLYILIERSSQPLLVISQFFKFFAEMPHISAERHLSKILF